MTDVFVLDPDRAKAMGTAGRERASTLFQARTQPLRDAKGNPVATTIDTTADGDGDDDGGELPSGAVKQAGFRSPMPKKPFDLKEGGWGALEVAARYGELDPNEAEAWLNKGINALKRGNSQLALLGAVLPGHAEEVLAAAPTKEFDAKYGKGFITPTVFVQRAYVDLKRTVK